MKQKSLIRYGILLTAMVGISFAFGWWSYGYSLANSRRVRFDFSKPYIVPSSHEPIGMTPTAETDSFLVGDRVDVFVETGHSVEALILDAIVTDQSKANFGLLLPRGGRTLFWYAMENELRLIYRLSKASTDPIALRTHTQ